MINTNTNTPRLIRLSEVRKLTCLSKSTIYSFINTKKFPKPISLGARSVAWLGHEVDQWIDDRIKQRDQMDA